MLVVGLQVQVQEVYTHMVQQSKVITISGRPGIGKTEVGGCSVRNSPKNLQRVMQMVGHKLRSSLRNLTTCARPRVPHYPVIFGAFLQVARQACEYARERCLFEETYFVSLQDKTTGAPITSLKEVAARIASVVGISEQVCVGGT